LGFTRGAAQWAGAADEGVECCGEAGGEEGRLNR